MILSGKKIEAEIAKGTIVIEPYSKRQLGPNSYNLRLHHELAYYDSPVLDMSQPQSLSRIQIPSDGLVLEANRLYLGRTIEYTETRGFVPMLEGRSSIGRLGLSVHITAGFGDVGFRGFWTLEICAIAPIRIFSGVEICQVFYHEITGDFDEYRSDKYQDNRDLQPSLLFKEFKAER